jgi:AAA domain
MPRDPFTGEQRDEEDDEPMPRRPGDKVRVFTSTTAIMATVFAPLRWTVPGYVPEGLSILAGRQKLGKTWLAIDFAIAVAIGGFAMGSIECEQGDALYVDLENGPRRIQRRIGTLFPYEQSRPDLGRLQWATKRPSLAPTFSTCWINGEHRFPGRR